VLRAAGHEVEAVSDWPADPGDDEIMVHASQNQQILITLDKDFGELAVVHARPHAGIVRLVALRAESQGAAAAAAIAKYGQELTRGAIVTVEPGRVRIRPPQPEAH
jgi:predicted nuclease of predicted toxin-antitoxin system